MFFNYYVFGLVVFWIYKVVGGLLFKEFGWCVVVVKLIFGGGIRNVIMKFVSFYGEVLVSWSIEGYEFKLEVCIFLNMRGEVILFGEEVIYEVGFGVYYFLCKE